LGRSVGSAPEADAQVAAPLPEACRSPRAHRPAGAAVPAPEIGRLQAASPWCWALGPAGGPGSGTSRTRESTNLAFFLSLLPPILRRGVRACDPRSQAQPLAIAASAAPSGAFRAAIPPGVAAFRCPAKRTRKNGLPRLFLPPNERSGHVPGMTVVCAWCERTVQRSATTAAGTGGVHRVSHGLCRSCLEAKLATPPPPPLALSAQPAQLAAPA
jgi:hypothetical protein